MERLQKVLAHAGVAARRKCEELILQGRVQVNGVAVTELGVKVNPVDDKIAVDGKPIQTEPLTYILLYKPTGYITSVTDPEGRPTVMDLVHGVKERIYPVGRLDMDTSGLLLLTNDGTLSNGLMHPSQEIHKVYRATVKGLPGLSAIQRLQTGVLLKDGITATAQVHILKKNPRLSVLQITIHEGRNRQVRRMCEAVGHPVVELERIQLDFLKLDSLEVGQFRHLTSSEVKKLYEHTIEGHSIT